jgi:hypothetical protein
VPELYAVFQLAEHLHKTVAEILEMPDAEFSAWFAYLKLKKERTK